MLEEFAITPRRFSRSGSESWWNASLIDAPPEARRRGSSSLVPGFAVPESTRAAAVSTFSTLPGSYGAVTARLPRSSGSACCGSVEL